MIGIYKITSPIGKIYIGQSIHIEKRIAGYKRLSCKGQSLLYESLIKFGVQNHSFKIICECEISELNLKEIYYINLYSAIGKNGLNLKTVKIKKDILIEKDEIKYFDLSGIYYTENKKIYFERTGETFNSLRKLYEKHTSCFRSYASLCYDFKKNNKNKKL